jgi:biopolymer transport protein TolR
MAMGTAANSGGGGGRRRRGRKKSVMSEINITPMVDVMLVLLIIFMVAAPMMTSGVPLDLPQASASPMPSQADPITISVERDGAISINEEPVAEADLINTVTAMAVNGTEDRIFLRGDTTANYGAVMKVVGLLQRAGFNKMGFITSPPEP